MRKTMLVAAGLGSLLAGRAAAQAPAAAPPPATAAAAETAAPVAPQRAPIRSWTSDRREFAVGDVVTVLLDEYTLASADQSDDASDRRSRDAGLSAGQSVVKTVPSVGASFGTHNDAESRRIGRSHRQSRFRGEMTVQVTAVEAGGRLRIEGKKVVGVDKTREELVLKGWVRAQDVSADNLVESFRIGNAEIAYTSKGMKPKGGILSKLVGALWP